MGQQTNGFYEFGSFRLDTAEHLLWQNGRTVPLTPKAYETLLVLIKQRGRVVEKDELMKEIWPDTFVEEANLAHNISLLRRALGERPGEQQYIQTVPKRGYRFVAGVREVADQNTGPILPERSEIQSVTGDTGIAGQNEKVAPAHIASPFARPIFKVIVSVFLLSLLALVGVGLYLRSKPEQAVRSLAVLPFSNGSADPQLEYLSDGITASLINNLSQSPEMQVKSRTMAFHYKGQEANPQQVGRALGVSAIMTGKVVQQGDALIIQTDLVRVVDGLQIWGAQYIRKGSDIFAVQEEIARDIALKLRLKLVSADQKQRTKRYPANTEAYHCYLKGRHIMDKRSRETIAKSVGYFEQAIRLDPNYALAYADLSYAFVSLSFLGARPATEVMPKAKESVAKALEIDEGLAEAHTTLGTIKYAFDWDWKGAEQELQRAIEIDPNYGDARRANAFYLTYLGRFSEALAEINRAVELEPVSVLFNRDVAQILWSARRYDEVIEQCHKTLDLDPNMRTVYGWLARAYEKKGLYEQAIEAYLNSAEVFSFGPESGAALNEAYAVSGWKGFWRLMLEMVKKRSKQRYVSPFLFAEIYVRLGEKEQALHWLEKTYQERLSAIVALNVNPMWDEFHSDPRFTALLRRANHIPRAG
jgi:DNA-binding winged helix-turn-helix (wHTH) protein/TolB-like protein